MWPVADEAPALSGSAAGGVEAAARLTVTITDAKEGRRTPARVRIVDESGKPLGLAASPKLGRVDEHQLAVPGSVPGLPAQAIAVMYGRKDEAEGYGFQPDGSFYVSGSFDLPMPAGKFTITISKGYEYVAESELLTLEVGDHVTRRYDLDRWVDMPDRGWYSADEHIHIRRSPRDNPLILDWIAAEDIHIGVLLQMGDFWTTHFAQYAWGRAGRYQNGNHVLLSGQEEPRTSVLGHTISFGAEQFVRFRDDYYSYDRVFDRVHELGGVTGYAHQGMSFHGYRGMTLDVLAGKLDFLELLQFCVREGPLAVAHYYRFLDLGYKLTALAGSDFPWCGRGRRPGEEEVGSRIGDARFYTYVGDPFSYEAWMAAVKAGHTFVTSGPMLELKVNGLDPGSSLELEAGATVRISATSYGHASQVPLQRLQIIGHGKVLAEVGPGDRGQSAERLHIEQEFAAEHGIWLAARADADASQVAHTTPVYVTVDGDGFHNRSNLAAQIDLSKQYLQEIREALVPPALHDPGAAPGPGLYNASRVRLEERIAEAERILNDLQGRQ